MGASDDRVFWVLGGQRPVGAAGGNPALLAGHGRNYGLVEIGIVVAVALLLVAAVLALIDGLKVSAVLTGDFFDVHGWNLVRI
jgi:hypothetical protein